MYQFRRGCHSSNLKSCYFQFIKRAKKSAQNQQLVSNFFVSTGYMYFSWHGRFDVLFLDWLNFCCNIFYFLFHYIWKIHSTH